MTASHTFAAGAGPGFAAEPLPADYQPLVLFWQGSFYTCLGQDGNLADQDNWQKIALDAVQPNKQLCIELAIDGRKGRLTIIGHVRRDILLESGDVLMMELVTMELITRPLHAA
jgi:hypothetical protein